MNGLITVLLKECKDNLRDRRTILSSFSLSLLGPALFIGLMTFVLNTALGKSEDPVEFSIVGAEHAPGLVEFLRGNNTLIELLDTDDPEREVTEDRHNLVMVISEGYGERFTRGDINSIALIYDSSEIGSTRRHFSTLREMLNRYSRTIGILRLQLRGIDPAVASPIFVQEVDTASPAARAVSVLATLPYLLVLVVFMGGFYLAIDTTAGEREHGSLEPLLCQPIPRGQLVLGKLLATSVFSAIALVLFLLSLSASIPFVPLHRIGMSLNIGFTTAATIFVLSVPLMLFGAALLTTVASFSKSYKEAQTYLTMVILVPTMPIILTQLLNLESSAGLMLVPSLSQGLLVGELIGGAAVNPVFLAISMLSTSAGAAVLAWLAIRLYSRERILI